MRSISTEDLFNRVEGKAPEKSKIEGGIFTAKDCKISMVHAFTNGKQRGETTNFKSIDPHFTWKKGQVTCVTGWPQHGKTELTYQMMLAKSLHNKWKWGIYSPENMSVNNEGAVSPEEIFDTLIHSLAGKGADPHFKNNQMPLSDYEYWIEFISEFFFVIYPEADHTIKLINEYFAKLKEEKDIDGCLIDPFNSLEYEVGEREDQFLKGVLSNESKFAKKYNVCKIITAHPSGKPIIENGLVKAPDQFNLSGGSMWNNKCDNILSVNRPKYYEDKADTLTEFHSHKIKTQKLVGIPGTVQLTKDRKTNRYYEMNGSSPLENVKEVIYNPNKFHDERGEDIVPF